MGKVPIEKRSHLAQNMIKRRRVKGWNQEALAHEAGIHHNIVKKIETDKGEGERETREAIAKALGCTLSELYMPSNDAIKKAIDLKVSEKQAVYGADIPTQMNEIKEMIKELQKPVDISQLQLAREREIKNLEQDNEDLRKQIHALVQENEKLKLSKDESKLLTLFRRTNDKSLHNAIIDQVARLVPPDNAKSRSGKRLK